MSLSKRLKQMMMHLGMNQTEFGEKIGVSGTVVSHWVTERNEPISSKLVAILETFPAFSVEWLVLGKGLMLKEEVKEEEGKKQTEVMIQQRLKVVEERLDELIEFDKQWNKRKKKK